MPVARSAGERDAALARGRRGRRLAWRAAIIIAAVVLLIAMLYAIIQLVSVLNHGISFS